MNKEKVYRYLENLGIEYEVFDHPHAYSMDECKNLDSLVGGKICKNLYLRTTNGKTRILLIIDSDKQFVTKDVSKSVGTSRLSFCSAEEMENDLGTKPGSLSLLSLIFDKNNEVNLVIDSDVINEEYFLCHPCDNTSTVKIKTEDVIKSIIPSFHKEYKVIEIK